MSYEDNLVIQAKNGDSNAINFLLDNNKSYIYAIAFAVLKNHEDAEDATQKTMITVWQNIGTLENPEAFKSWLYHIAHTRSLNVLQSKKNNRFILDEDISDLPHLEDMENDFMLPQVYAEREDLCCLRSMRSVKISESGCSALLTVCLPFSVNRLSCITLTTEA